jgi:hypothetical protein
MTTRRYQPTFNRQKPVRVQDFVSENNSCNVGNTHPALPLGLAYSDLPDWAWYKLTAAMCTVAQTDFN